MSSPITLSGFNNIDFKAIVGILIKSERAPIDRLATQKQNEQNRLSAYTSLSASLSSLQSAFSAVQTSGAFGSLQAYSSDTAILSASATSSASKGSFTIDVTSLARPQVTSSAAGQFSDINAAIIDGGTFSITQHGTTTGIDLAGVSSLAQLRDAINTQQSGVKASIINDGSTSGNPPKPFRLVLTAQPAVLTVHLRSRTEPLLVTERQAKSLTSAQIAQTERRRIQSSLITASRSTALQPQLLMPSRGLPSSCSRPGVRR